MLPSYLLVFCQKPTYGRYLKTLTYNLIAESVQKKNVLSVDHVLRISSNIRHSSTPNIIINQNRNCLKCSLPRMFTLRHKVFNILHFNHYRLMLFAHIKANQLGTFSILWKWDMISCSFPNSIFCFGIFSSNKYALTN